MWSPVEPSSSGPARQHLFLTQFTCCTWNVPQIRDLIHIFIQDRNTARDEAGGGAGGTWLQTLFQVIIQPLTCGNTESVMYPHNCHPAHVALLVDKDSLGTSLLCGQELCVAVHTHPNVNNLRQAGDFSHSK